MVKDGRRKGNQFELRCCRYLSVWLFPKCEFGNRADGLPFRRRFTATTPLEGHWVRKGDILHRPDAGIDFPFSVECKATEDWRNLDGMFNGNKWPVWEYWRQATVQGLEDGTVPLLLFTRNRSIDYYMIDEEVGRWLKVKPKTKPVLQAQVPKTPGSVLIGAVGDLVQTRYRPPHWVKP
jgi:hypothetical protein